MKPVALLHELEITEDLASGDKINDSLRITNNRKFISALVHPQYRPIMGQMEVASLLTGAPVVFAQANIPNDVTPQQYLLARLYEVQSFLITTWVIQDNAINCELGFLLFEEGPVETATSNFVAHLYSTARGQKPVTKLSRAQLRGMRAFHRTGFRPPDHAFALPTSQLTSTQPRLSRALYLVNAARGESDIAIKVAHYCTVFETLFATTHTELAHQLSERVACYLCDNAEERLRAYRRVKSAYALRSKVVHGSTVRDNKLDEALEIAEYCDQLARQILRRLLTDGESRALFERDSESLDEEMLKIIFAG